jgi:hypothetical protein
MARNEASNHAQVLSAMEEMGIPRERVLSASQEQQSALLKEAMSSPNWPKSVEKIKGLEKTAVKDLTQEDLEKLVNKAVNGQQKSWFADYIYDTDRNVLSNLGSIVTGRPVEGVVTGLTGSWLLGKTARVGAMAAALYYGTPYLFQAFGAAEKAATGTGMNWLGRFGNSIKTLASPGLVGGDGGVAMDPYGGSGV